jgi:hypothetical protein
MYPPFWRTVVFEDPLAAHAIPTTEPGVVSAHWYPYNGEEGTDAATEFRFGYLVVKRAVCDRLCDALRRLACGERVDTWDTVAQVYLVRHDGELVAMRARYAVNAEGRSLAASVAAEGFGAGGIQSDASERLFVLKAEEILSLRHVGCAWNQHLESPDAEQMELRARIACAVGLVPMI